MTWLDNFCRITISPDVQNSNSASTPSDVIPVHTPPHTVPPHTPPHFVPAHTPSQSNLNPIPQPHSSQTPQQSHLLKSDDNIQPNSGQFPPDISIQLKPFLLNSSIFNPRTTSTPLCMKPVFPQDLGPKPTWSRRTMNPRINSSFLLRRANIQNEMDSIRKSTLTDVYVCTYIKYCV